MIRSLFKANGPYFSNSPPQGELLGVKRKIQIHWITICCYIIIILPKLSGLTQFLWVMSLGNT